MPKELIPNKNNIENGNSNNTYPFLYGIKNHINKLHKKVTTGDKKYI